MQITRTVAPLSLLACGLALMASQAQAGIVQVTDPAQIPITDTLGSFPGVPNPAPLGSPAASPTTVSSPFTEDPYGNPITISDTGGFQVDGNDIGFTNENPVTGAPIFTPGFGILDNSVGSGPVTISFQNPVTMFGLDAYSLDNVQNFDFSVLNGATTLGTFSIYNDPAGITDPTYGYASPDFTPVFFGVKTTGSDVITSITISSPNVAASGFAIGTAVPEASPAALAGLGLALGLLPLAARRRRCQR